jgi:sugar lactone lactonase YvrE
MTSWIWRAAMLGGLAFACDAQALTLTELWRVQGLEGPESAVFDPQTGAIYVSNTDGGATAKDGKGSISKISPDGKMLEPKWVSGLNSPKGLAIANGKLYASDIDRIDVIDIASGKVEAKLDAPGAKFLNDTTAAADGRVFLSDMATNTIWVVDGGKASAWLQSDDLLNPNGLLAQPGRIVVASWGKMEPDFSTKVPGHVKVVDLATKKVSDLGDPAPVGNLDGIESDGKGGFIATDWVAGGVISVGPDGKATKVLALPQGSADIGVIADKGVLLVPLMKDNTLVAFRMQ